MANLDLQTLYNAITKSKICYFYCDPPIVDFTQRYTGDFVICTPTEKVSIRATPEQVLRLQPFFSQVLFTAERLVLTWDIKQYMSYVRFNYELNNRPVPPIKHERSIIDLKYTKFYCGNRKDERPTNIKDATAILTSITDSNNWQKAYKNVHLPLALRAIPSLECRGFGDTEQSKALYSSYEIEGTVNGRLATHKHNTNFASVHNAEESERAKYRPLVSYDDYVVLSLDYHQMEVCMLAWLSGDAALKAALKGKDDVYASLFHEGTIEERKKMGKKAFVPTMYGVSANTLAEQLNLPAASADDLISRIKAKFKVAFDWLDDQRNLPMVNGCVEDIMGRRRNFTDESIHKIRNFVVQSPSALFCLCNLVRLYDRIGDSVWYNVHDGFVIVAKKSRWREVACEAKEVLTSENDLFPGLTIQIGAKAL